MAKALFRPPYNIAKLDCFVRYRLKRFVSMGVVKQVKRKRKLRYSVDGERVFFGEGVLRMDGVGEVDMGYFIVVKKENETVAKSIDDYERRLMFAKSFSEKHI